MKTEDIEIEDLDSEDIGESVDTTPGKKTIKINFHYVFLAAVALIVVIVIIALLRWNNRSVDIGDEEDPALFELECNDFFVYPDAEALANHKDNGKHEILMIGNGYASHKADGKSVVDIIKAKTDAKIYTLLMDSSYVTSLSFAEDAPTDGIDAFSLYRVVNALCTGEDDFMDSYDGLSSMNISGSNAFKDYLKTIHTLDLNNIDTVIIMYDLSDYYRGLPTIMLSQDNIAGYYGAMDVSVKMLREYYPHLNIVISSTTPEYMVAEDGSLDMSNVTDYGFGNSSEYNSIGYVIALDNVVSYIDNYYYCVRDDCIEEYIENFYLNRKGVEAIGNHIVEFLKQYEGK